MVNWLRPLRWLKHNASIVQLRTVDVLRPLLMNIESPVVTVIGVGHGNIFHWLWNEACAVRIGVDVNHQVMLQALAENGHAHYCAVEGDARHLPFPDASVDIVVYDFSLHHLVGQGRLEDFIAEGSRVLRPGGFIIAREPSSYSPSGLALNALNSFGLMHKLTGASSQEFALSPPQLIQIFQRHGSVLAVEGLTYLFAHRLPPWLQDLIVKSEPYLFGGSRRRWFADFLLYAVQKAPRAVEPML
jgi:SAM-dependent methyltransferase